MSNAAVSKDAVEAIIAAAPVARVTQDFLEVLIPTVSRSPSTPTGAGVSKDALEVVLAGSTRAAVTQDVLEVLLLDTSTIGEVGAGTVQTIAYGWVE